MKKRIGINIMLAFIICDLVNLVKSYIQIVLLHNNSFYTGSYYGYIKMTLFELFLLFPLFFLVFVLLPYNWIILWYVRHKKKWLSLVQKIIFFFLIIVVDMALLGTFMNIWPFNWSGYLKYFIGFSIYSLLFAIPIHFLVDVPEQRKMKDYDKKAD